MGFLYFNFPPAKIFMGDCGSLYLGSVLGSVAIILRSEILLLIVGFLFFMEALSVIIQVVFFKITHKRIFLMTPIHHHFEKKGIDEVRVVMGFYLVGVFLSVLGLIIESL
jgi:phospho-N-acetylmuramoyl-pentapeptide-transferase